MRHTLTPLAVAERIFGGLCGVATILEVSDKAPYHWRYQRGNRDAGDFPSLTHVRRLHEEARDRGLQVPLKWLVYGAAEAEVDALIRPIAAE